ncbi:histidine phosphatase family protein [Limosilactobacillus sp. STM2_1]|uniref:Histidine phosphatase family protein n=1 Tax=Limosilactobacillus rudii TaxID=2759755 RepID=A0A7W3YMG6_9LACO|nr:histidine phosphatase family protein [Limosilactobacillus rudii]MBB1079408.1 histidine phosphatase family protein [Limosilactobacillus rudii]MBB1097454.1 histidine phosphatase family protein [Limosilactobacillus rudii]MCD7134563.1 histidine phosphatase family protein [Limosilactobacillus rudii]
MTTLLLIRHGETYANRLNYIQGTLNDQLATLTELGIMEAKNYQKLLKDAQIDLVYTSPLKRALVTSKIICKNSNIQVRIDSRLREISYGKWNGTAINELKSQYATYFDSETNDVYPHSIEINQGENFDHARKRVWAFVTEISKKYPNQTILIVTHGWVIKNIIALCLKTADGTAFKNPQNLSISKVQVDSITGKQRVCYYNRPIKGIGKL